MRLASVRLRTTFVAVVVVGVALAAGAVTLVLLLRDQLTDDVRRAAQLRAEDVASVIDAGATLGQLSVDDDVFVQVVAPDGEVVAASSNVEGAPAVVELEPGESAEVDVPFDDDPFLAVAVATESDDEMLTVVAARTLDSVEESTATAARLLAIGYPILMVLVGFTTWKVTGRALAPVEAMRQEVEAISAEQLHRRVPAPPGRDEIARLADTMNHMLDRLERSQEEQRRFVSDASHELRSPVASIRQHAEVARSHPASTSVSELADSVLAEDLRVQRLVDDLLLLARADEGGLELRRRPVDLDDIVFEEAGRLRSTTPLRVDTTKVSAGRVVADESALQRVVRNVAENAARHARARVEFELFEHDGSTVLRVDDDGPGIARIDRERVFERFVRLEDSRARSGGGSGLGLAIVAELVTAQGGKVSVAEGTLGGTRLEIVFSEASGGF